MQRTQYRHIPALFDLATGKIDLLTHGPGPQVQAHFRIGKRGNIHRHVLEVGALENSRTFKLLGQRLTQFASQKV